VYLDHPSQNSIAAVKGKLAAQKTGNEESQEISPLERWSKGHMMCLLALGIFALFFGVLRLMQDRMHWNAIAVRRRMMNGGQYHFLET
jgi:hypothetical protein